MSDPTSPPPPGVDAPAPIADAPAAATAPAPPVTERAAGGVSGPSEKPAAPLSLTPPPPQVRRISAPPTGIDPYAGIDRVARVQTIAAILLGLVLIAIPLYLWRRPRADAPPVTSQITPNDAGLLAAGSPTDSGVPVAQPLAAPVVALSEAKVMECHDPGSRHTAAADCDHLAPLEKGLAAAITSAGACVPPSVGGGTLVYVVDASFLRKHHPLELFVPRDGRALKNNGKGAASAVKECTQAVKEALAGVSLDGVAHAHARYKVAITATYAASASSNVP